MRCPGTPGNERRQRHTGIVSHGDEEFHAFPADIIGHLEGVVKDLFQLGIGGAFKVKRTPEHETERIVGYFLEELRSLVPPGRNERLKAFHRLAVSIDKVKEAQGSHQLRAGTPGQNIAPIAAVDA